MIYSSKIRLETEAAKITKVLIINDSGFERMVLRDQVRMLGYEVKTADEISSLHMMKKFHPDIVIANLTMGDISGDQLIAHIKSMDPEIRCYLSSCSKINLHQVDGNLINGIIETPINNAILESILKNPGLEYAQKPGQEPISTMQSPPMPAHPAPSQHRCPSCQKELEKTGKFAFCPFCGTRL